MEATRCKEKLAIGQTGNAIEDKVIDLETACKQFVGKVKHVRTLYPKAKAKSKAKAKA